MLFLDLIMSLPMSNASAGQQCAFTERLSAHSHTLFWMCGISQSRRV